MKVKINKKGSTMFIILAFLVLGITIMGFTYDLCRVLFYKTYLKNAATLMSLSITHRCHYIDTDKAYFVTSDKSSTGEIHAGVIIMQDEYNNKISSNGSRDLYITDDAYDKYNSQIESSSSIQYCYSCKKQYLTDTAYCSVCNSPTASSTTKIFIDLKDYYRGGNPFHGQAIINPTVDNQGTRLNFPVVFADDFFKSLVAHENYMGVHNIKKMVTSRTSAPTYSKFGGADFILSTNESNINSWDSLVAEIGASEAKSLYLKNSLTGTGGPYKLADIQNIGLSGVEELNRFMYGKDGINGEVQVYLVGYVKFFFLNNGLFDIGQDCQRVTALAMSQPQVHINNLSSLSTRSPSKSSPNTYLS